jgi:hypothetical protein
MGRISSDCRHPTLFTEALLCHCQTVLSVSYRDNSFPVSIFVSRCKPITSRSYNTSLESSLTTSPPPSL